MSYLLENGELENSEVKNYLVRTPLKYDVSGSDTDTYTDTCDYLIYLFFKLLLVITYCNGRSNFENESVVSCV